MIALAKAWTHARRKDNYVTRLGMVVVGNPPIPIPHRWYATLTCGHGLEVSFVWSVNDRYYPGCPRCRDVTAFVQHIVGQIAARGES